MYELLKQIDDLHSKLLGCISSNGKANNGWAIIRLLKEHPELKKYWYYDDSARKWDKRFIKLQEYTFVNGLPIDCGYSVVNGCVVDPITNLKNAPSHQGLYLLGQTTFNPYTDEKQYWIKVGYGSNISSRLQQYTTTSPCTALIDTTHRTQEKLCHQILKMISIGKCQQNREWFLVDRETYLTICKKKFKYFGF